MSNSFDFEQFKANAIEQLKARAPLSGNDGVLAPLLENLLNSAMDGEMDSHLEGGERELGNRRNGHMSKQVQTSMGEESRRSGSSQYRIGGIRPSNWLSCSQTGSVS